MEKTKKTHGINFLRIYLLIATLAGVFGTLISFGILIHSILSNVIITDEEYVAGSRYYELEVCSNQYEPKTTKLTEEEITKCKKEKTENMINGRNLEYKQDILGGSIRGFLFLILSIIHYPKFMKSNKND